MEALLPLLMPALVIVGIAYAVWPTARINFDDFKQDDDCPHPREAWALRKELNMGYLKTPTGKRIVATVETIPGACAFSHVDIDEEGNWEMDYDGHTQLDWDAQKTLTINGERVFIDEETNLWLEGTLTFNEGD